MAELIESSSTTSSDFKYVKIPSDPNLPIEQLSASKAGGLQNDEMIKLAKQYFTSTTNTQTDPEQDKAMAASIRAEAIKAGANPAQLSAVNDAALLALHNSTTCEITCLTLPVAANSKTGVSMYTDDKGRGKGLGTNVRASELARTCGNPDADIKGDAFVSRYIDDEEGDVWERVDFEVKEAQGETGWTEIGKGRGGSLSNVMQGGGGAMEMGRAQGQNAPDVVRKGDGYEWTENPEEVEIRWGVGGGVKGRDVKVKFGARKLKVEVRGEVKVEGELGGAVVIDECTWCVEGEELVVTLGKREGGTMWGVAVK
ncbi:hypothetical protein TrCOL_g6502 [Triparma columacea]|uniref:CS domain-containing protein n=1 Tax=Triparma columacea TaxID=722753 RepID=A0A9W7L9E6_9STRA|nr:hypothetical protein TrCOL_g6502 [Triparma columacea]